MNNQLKYKVTYGYNVTKKEIEVYAFDIVEAIEIANRVMQSEPNLPRISEVKQINDKT